jgi:hypothetical protein
MHLCLPDHKSRSVVREGAALGVSRIRRTATKRRSLALAAAHAGTCKTGIFKRPVRKGTKQKEENEKLESMHLNCATEQPCWTDVTLGRYSGLSCVLRREKAED